jgi:ribonuclease HI
MKLKLFTDGGARGNPGPAGIGAVIYDDKNKVLEKLKKYIGETTNNQAEYQALVLGLNKAKDLKATEVECFLDSELVVKQLNGQYKVKDQELAKHFLTIWNLKNDFKKVTFKHIRREKNELADQLVNEAIDRCECANSANDANIKKHNS